VFWCLDTKSLHLQASLVNFKLRQLAKIRCCIELELNIVYNFWSSAFIEKKRKLTKVSFFEKLKNIDRNELTGEICTEFQLSISANFKLSWVVNFVKKVL
jgi:hypothetical protein